MRAPVLLLLTLVACGDSANEPHDPGHLMLGTFHMVGAPVALHETGTPCEIYLVRSTITTQNDGSLVRRDSIESDAAFGMSTPGTAAVVKVSATGPAERVEITHAGRVMATCGEPEYAAGAHVNIGQLRGDTLLLGVQHEVTGVAGSRIRAIRYER